MMNHLWSLLCKKAIVDVQTNSLSLFGVLEQATITITSKKELKEISVIPMDFDLASFWVDEDGRADKQRDIQMLIEISGPDKKKTELSKQKIEVKKGIKRMRTFNHFDGIKFRGPGIYKFVIKHKVGGNYRTVAEVPLEVIVQIKDK